MNTRQGNTTMIMMVEDSGLHLIPDKAYLGTTSDGEVTCTSVDTFCSDVWKSNILTKCITVEMTPDDFSGEEKIERWSSLLCTSMPEEKL